MLSSNTEMCTKYAKMHWVNGGQGLPIGYVGLSLGLQDPRGIPANCGTHKVNCRYMMRSISNHQHFFFIKFSVFHLIRFRFKARVFQRVSMNLNMTIGQAAYQILWIQASQRTLAATCVLLNRPIVTCESGERNCLWLFVFETHLIKA